MSLHAVLDLWLYRLYGLMILLCDKPRLSMLEELMSWWHVIPELSRAVRLDSCGPMINIKWPRKEWWWCEQEKELQEDIRRLNDLMYQWKPKWSYLRWWDAEQSPCKAPNCWRHPVAGQQTCHWNLQQYREAPMWTMSWTYTLHRSRETQR